MVITVQLFYSQIHVPLPFSLHLGGLVTYLSGFLEAPLCICPQVVLWMSFKNWLFYMICHGIYSNKSFFYHVAKKKKKSFVPTSLHIDGINFQNGASALLGWRVIGICTFVYYCQIVPQTYCDVFYSHQQCMSIPLVHPLATGVHCEPGSLPLANISTQVSWATDETKHAKPLNPVILWREILRGICYLICGINWKTKMWSLCSKITKNFKLVWVEH